MSTTTRPIRAGRPFAVAGHLVDLALLAVIAVGLTSVLFGRILPAVGHPVYVVSGPSMLPALPVGTAVALDAVAPERLEVGDVVTLTSGPGRAVFTHRIVRLVDREDGRWIETKGDNNEFADPALTPISQVIGRVGVAVPGVGYLLTLVSTIQGLVLLLGIGATLMALGWFLDDLVLDRRRRAYRAATAMTAAANPLAAFGPMFPALAGPPIVMPARAALAMHPPAPAPKRTRRTKAAAVPAAAEPVAASAEATLPTPGTISAIELLRADPDGRRRRRRADLARSRP
jgi:signal peptidase